MRYSIFFILNVSTVVCDWYIIVCKHFVSVYVFYIHSYILHVCHNFVSLHKCDYKKDKRHATVLAAN